MRSDNDGEPDASGSPTTATAPRMTLTIFEFRDGQIAAARFLVTTQAATTQADATPNVTTQKLSSEPTLPQGRLFILQL